MAKTDEELKALKTRVDELRNELSELTDEELDEVTGGVYVPCYDLKNPGIKRWCLKIPDTQRRERPQRKT